MVDAESRGIQKGPLKSSSTCVCVSMYERACVPSTLATFPSEPSLLTEQVLSEISFFLRVNGSEVKLETIPVINMQERELFSQI